MNKRIIKRTKRKKKYPVETSQILIDLSLEHERRKSPDG